MVCFSYIKGHSQILSGSVQRGLLIPCYDSFKISIKKSAMNNKEIWKDIPSFNGYYQASTYGRIRRIRKPVIDSKGRTQTMENE